jgi:hypothetical protein
VNTRERIKRALGKASTCLVVVREHVFNVKSLGTFTLARPREWFGRRKDRKIVE